MPGVSSFLKARKPEVEALERDTLSAKLKRRRLELGLRQVDAASLLGIGENTLVDWERGQSRPTARSYPAIIVFLGFEPWLRPQTLGERLRARRLRSGLSVKQAAKAIGVDELTFGAWEHGTRRPSMALREVCDQFLAE